MVAAVTSATWRVNGHIRRDPVALDQLLCEVMHKPLSLGRGKLGGQGDNELAGNLRIFARFAPLHGVPQLGPISRPLRRTFRQENLRRLDTAFSDVVIHDFSALVRDRRTGAVGRRSRCAASFGSRYHFYLKYINRHAGSPGVEGLAPRATKRKFG